MRPLAAVLLAVATLLGAHAAARGADVSLCCACVPTGAGVTEPIPAYFCAPSAGANTTALVDRCVAITDPAKLFCTADSGNSTCVGQLSEREVACPAPAPAPVATPLNLGTLAVVLAAAGAFLLRRRRTLG